MLRSLGLSRAVLLRSRADWPIALAAWILLVCATTLLAASLLYGDAVSLGGLRHSVASALPVDSAVVVRSDALPQEAAGLDRIVVADLGRSLSGPGGEVVRVARSGSFALTGSGDDVEDLTELATYEGIEKHASLLQGAWPATGSDPLQAALSEGAARALDLPVGGRISLTSRLDSNVSVTVVVAGIYRPDASDAYWLSSPLELDGVQVVGRFTTRGPFILAQGDLLARHLANPLALEWRGLIDAGHLGLDDIDSVRTSVDSLSDRLASEFPPGRHVRVTTRLSGLLGDAGRAVLVTRSGIALLTIQFAILAGYAIILVAGMLYERRQAQTALLRSRGAGDGHLVAMVLAESLVLAAAAGALAPWLGLGVIRLLGAIGQLRDSAVLADLTVSPLAIGASASAAFAGAIALSLPTLGARANLGGIRASLGRQSVRTLGQRLGIDVLLLAVAIVGLWQLRLYGAPLTRNARGTLGLDPFLVAAPGIGLLAGALLAARIVPRFAEIIERLLERRPGLVGPLGSHQLARRPLRYTRSALLLMLAAALGTFGAAHAATWNRSQSDQAAYRSAADVRVVVADYPVLQSWAVGPALRRIPGVESAMPVVHQAIDVGNSVRGGLLMGIGPETTSHIISYTPDEVAAGLPGLVGQLGSARGPVAGLDVPANASRISVVVDANLVAADESVPIAADWQGLDLTAVIEDGDGRLHRLQGEPGRFVGARQRLVLSFLDPSTEGELIPAAPLRLRALELKVAPATDAVAVGRVDIRELAWSGPGGGDAWTTIPIDAAAGGWGWLRVGQNQILPVSAGPDHPLGISLGGPDTSDEAQPAFGFEAPVFRLQQPPPEEVVLPAIVGRRFLELSGAQVGDRITASIEGRPQDLNLIGVTDTFPPLDPSVPFVIVDDRTLDNARFDATGQTLAASEWWLGVSAGRTADVEAAAVQPPFTVASVIGRETLASSLATDPVALGLIGVIGLGSVASVVFAAVGFVVSAGVSAGERLGEFALLRALGMSGRQLSIWLSLENLFLLLVGLASGLLLGLVLAWLVLPFVALTQTGAAPVPAPVVVIPWEQIEPLYIVSFALLVPTVLVVRRQLATVHVGSVLRAFDS